MKKTIIRIIGILAGVLGLLFSMVSLILLSGEINDVVMGTTVFVLLAYIGTFVFLCMRSGTSKTPQRKGFHLPVTAVGAIYMMLQIPLCMVFGLLSRIVPLWSALLINAIVAIVAWRILLKSLAKTGGKS